MSKVIAVTGHRPQRLCGYGAPAQRVLENIAYAHLKAIAPDRVITGMALGWDRAVAEMCMVLDIPFVAAIPFHGQESRWSERDQQVYNLHLSYADEIVYVNDGGFSPQKMLQRNIWMVDNSAALLAMFDGQPGSGTAHCVDYARSLRRPIKNLFKELDDERYYQRGSQELYHARQEAMGRAV